MVGVAERDVDRAVHLLVEEDVLHVARDPRVAADPELAEPPGALVGIKGLEQELLVRVGARVDDRARFEAQADPPDLAPRVQRGKLGEGDLALGGILQRAAEELAAGNIAAGRRHPHRPTGERQPKIGPGGDDSDLLGSVETIGVAPHRLPQLVPVDQTGAEEEVGELGRAHAGFLGQRGRRVLAADPRHLVPQHPFHRGTPAGAKRGKTILRDRGDIARVLGRRRR